VAQLSAPGERLQVVSKVDSHNPTDGVTGLKALGVRELTYRLVFLASSIQSADTQAGFANIRDDSEDVRGKPQGVGQGGRSRKGKGVKLNCRSCVAGRTSGAHTAHARPNRPSSLSGNPQIHVGG
jgi:hypothetical protein